MKRRLISVLQQVIPLAFVQGLVRSASLGYYFKTAACGLNIKRCQR
jgi:hypothetical protein